MRFTLFLFLIVSLILELSITTIPLILIFLNCFMVIYKRFDIALFVFIFVLFFDILIFNEIGISALFFTTFLFLVLLYQRKFEINRFSFVGISTFLASLTYLFIIFSKLDITQAVASAIIAVLFIFTLHR